MQTPAKRPIPTFIGIAPRGHSFHGQSLLPDELGLPCRPEINSSESALIVALRLIVLETMHFSPSRCASDSYLPEDVVEQAQKALSLYGLRIESDPAMMAPEPPKTPEYAYFPKRTSDSPYDVSIACAEIDQINGLMTDRQTVELLGHVLARANPENASYQLIQAVVVTMQKAMGVAA